MKVLSQVPVKLHLLNRKVTIKGNFATMWKIQESLCSLFVPSHPAHYSCMLIHK